MQYHFSILWWLFHFGDCVSPLMHLGLGLPVALDYNQYSFILYQTWLAMKRNKGKRTNKLPYSQNNIQQLNMEA